jgi:hypothetical protein
MKSLRCFSYVGMLVVSLGAHAGSDKVTTLESPALTMGSNWLVRINLQESNWVEQVRDKCDFRFQVVTVESQSILLCTSNRP